MTKPTIADLMQSQREFFADGRTRDIRFREKQLKSLMNAVLENEEAVFDALKLDMKRPRFEAYSADIAHVKNEITFALKNLRSWARPKKARTPFAFFPARSYVYSEPYGIALIMGPWNYPVQLLLAPLVGAISAGNCAVLKPSEHAEHSSRLIAKICSDNFDPAYISVVEGGVETGKTLLREKFDYIFFSGGPAVGRKVMEAAAKHLTPVTLELGGKSPCIVDIDIDVEVAARRIVWGKFFNAGQTCIAVDYLLVHKQIREELVEYIKKYIREFFGADPSKSPDYARIINKRHFDRVNTLLSQGRIITGGRTDPEDLYISPTVIDEVSPDFAVMQEEIFGPILPVIEYDNLDDAIRIVNERPKPLALYLFSRDREKQKLVLNNTSSGGGCINDTMLHQPTVDMPFGGVGESGIGNYHGLAGFETFSHKRSIIRKSFMFDLKLRYPPYENHLRFLKKLF